MPHTIKVPVKSRVAVALIVTVQISFILSVILRLNNHQDCDRSAFRYDAKGVLDYRNDKMWSNMVARDHKSSVARHDDGWDGERLWGHPMSNLEADEFAWNPNHHETIDVDGSCLVWQWICDIFM